MGGRAPHPAVVWCRYGVGTVTVPYMAEVVLPLTPPRSTPLLLVPPSLSPASWCSPWRPPKSSPCPPSREDRPLIFNPARTIEVDCCVPRLLALEAIPSSPSLRPKNVRAHQLAVPRLISPASLARFDPTDTVSLGALRHWCHYLILTPPVSFPSHFLPVQNSVSLFGVPWRKIARMMANY